jgi:hypothetical protein
MAPTSARLGAARFTIREGAAMASFSIEITQKEWDALAEIEAKGDKLGLDDVERQLLQGVLDKLRVQELIEMNKPPTKDTPG